MEVKGTTRVCGLIGDPVAHTKSPLIQNMLADLCGIDLVYVPFHVTARSEEEMRALVQGAYALDILGLNATIPFKQLVIPHLVSIDPVAERIGAVNTLVRAENGYKGYNTDIAGLERDLASHGISPAGRNILIIGSGGAARGAAFWCASCGPASLVIANRTLPKAQALGEEVATCHPDLAVRAIGLHEIASLAERYLVIQCSGIGFGENRDKSPIEDERFFRQADFAYDVVYAPLKTRFLEQAEAAGVPYANGLGMLLGQGIRAFELWTGVSVSREQEAAVRDVLLKAQ